MRLFPTFITNIACLLVTNKAGNKEMLEIYNDNLQQDLKMLEDNNSFTARK